MSRFSLSFNFSCIYYVVTHCASHLFVHEDVDDGVDDRAALGEDRRHDARHRADESRPAEGGHHGDDAVRHPAEQVTDHRGDDHEQDVELAPPRRRPPDATHLTGKQETVISHRYQSISFQSGLYL